MVKPTSRSIAVLPPLALSMTLFRETHHATLNRIDLSYFHFHLSSYCAFSRNGFITSLSDSVFREAVLLFTTELLRKTFLFQIDPELKKAKEKRSASKSANRGFKTAKDGRLIIGEDNEENVPNVDETKEEKIHLGLFFW